MSEKIIHVGGAKGVGKSTILHELEIHNKKEIAVIYTSRFLYELCRKEYCKPLSELKKEEVRRLQEITMTVAKQLPHRVVLFDSHYVDLSGGKIIELTPEHHKKEFVMHILLEADILSILQRRVNDSARVRELDLKMIALEMFAERKAAFQIASENNAKVYIVKNESITVAVNEIKEILERDLNLLLR